MIYDSVDINVCVERGPGGGGLFGGLCGSAEIGLLGMWFCEDLFVTVNLVDIRELNNIRNLRLHLENLNFN